ncbi:MAG: PilZ domain-containing protein [Candidatus Acidiferrales bacterium]
MPRVPLLTQVEERRENFTTLGWTKDISLGGLSITTQQTLPAGTTVVVRFGLPGRTRAIEAAGCVAWVVPGKSMGIGFLGLLEEDRQRIADYVATLPELSEEEAAARSFTLPEGRRRSARLPRKISVTLLWQDAHGQQQQDAAETVLVSQYGAMVATFTPLQPGRLVWVVVPALNNKKELARVVWVNTATRTGRVEMGIEMLGAENFWEIEFPAQAAESAEPRSRGQRRSARLEQRQDVVLNWEDEWGRAREEAAQTWGICQHGALVGSRVALAERQILRIRVPELNREGEARVVHARPGFVPGYTDLGIEFIGPEDFWGFEFPPDDWSPGDPEGASEGKPTLPGASA